MSDPGAMDEAFYAKLYAGGFELHETNDDGARIYVRWEPSPTTFAEWRVLWVRNLEDDSFGIPPLGNLPKDDAEHARRELERWMEACLHGSDKLRRNHNDPRRS